MATRKTATKPARPVIAGPVWRQIADFLRTEILTGQYPPGSVLPGEEHLAAEFGVSRHSVRQATAALTAEGLVTVRRPHGTTVRDPHARPPHTTVRTLSGVKAGYVEPNAADWSDVGRPSFVTLDATADQAAWLGIEPGEPMLVREVTQQADPDRRRTVRLMIAFRTAAELETPWVDKPRLPAPAAVYAWYGANGHPPTFTDYVTARMPVGDEVTALHAAPGSPLLTVTRIATSHGRPLAAEQTATPASSTELAYPVA